MQAHALPNPPPHPSQCAGFRVQGASARTNHSCYRKGEKEAGREEHHQTREEGGRDILKPWMGQMGLLYKVDFFENCYREESPS